MPHVTEHAPKVSTRSVNPYARESSREKLQQDRHTHTHSDGLSKTTFLDVLKVIGPSQIRSYLKLDFLHDAITSIDMEVIFTHAWRARELSFNGSPHSQSFGCMEPTPLPDLMP